MPPHLAKDAIFWRDIYSIATDMTGVLASMMAITRMKEPHEPTMDEFGKRFNRYLEYWDGLMADRKFAAELAATGLSSARMMASCSSSL